MARSNNQVVEVIPLMDGEDSPRRVLCPWRVHPPASTLPAVARATAGRFVRCEWLIGRVVCVPKSPASGFCVSCSGHGWPSVVRCLGHWLPSAESRLDLRSQGCHELGARSAPCTERLEQREAHDVFDVPTTKRQRAQLSGGDNMQAPGRAAPRPSAPSA